MLSVSNLKFLSLADQRLAAPVSGDEEKQPVLHLGAVFVIHTRRFS
jgi:hypothetical protein